MSQDPKEKHKRFDDKNADFASVLLEAVKASKSDLLPNKKKPSKP